VSVVVVSARSATTIASGIVWAAMATTSVGRSSFVCAMVAMAVGFALVRKYDVQPQVFQDVMVEGLAVEPKFDAVGLLNYQLGPTSLPQWKSSSYFEYTVGRQNFRFTLNYIAEYHDQRASILAPNPVNGAIQTNGRSIEAQTTLDFDYRALLPWDTTLVFSVDNVMDRDPSFARLDLNYDPFTGSALGRTFKFSLTKKF